MINVLVKYKKWVDASHPMLNDELIEYSTIVEVLKLTELNDMFDNITDVTILNHQN